jgi:hypothetical protein
MTVNNWQTEASKLSQAIHDPNSDSQKPIIVLGSPKDLRNVLSKPTTTPPNIMQTLSPRIRRLAMQMQARNGGGMPGMPGMPPGMPGMPLGMPSSGGSRADALKGLLGALMASRGGNPSGMPTGMPPSGGMPPAMPGMLGVAKSLKKGKTMNHSKGKFCADCGKLESKCNCDSGSCPECGANEKNCNCNDNKTGRGRKMNKRGSINKGMLDSITAFLNHVIHNTPYGEHGNAAGARLMATGQGGSLGHGGQNIAEQRRSRSNNLNDNPTFAQMRDRNAANKDRFESIKTNGQGTDRRVSYARTMNDPENPFNAKRGTNQTAMNSRNYDLKTRNAKDYHEMLMANPSAKDNYAASSAKNVKSYQDRAKEMQQINEMRRANPNGDNNMARQNREQRDMQRSKSNEPGAGKTYSRTTSTNKSMSKSITSFDKHGTRHVIGGYSMSKRARPASSSNTTRNKYGY